MALKSSFHQALSWEEEVDNWDYMDLFHAHACVKAETTHSHVQI